MEDCTAADIGVVLLRWNGFAAAWSAPIRINDTTHDGVAYFPALTTVSGRPGVLHYFRRHGAASVAATDVFLTTIDGDRLNHLQLNTVSSDWAQIQGDRVRAPVQRIFGDYISVASSRNRVAAAWTDARSGVP